MKRSAFFWIVLALISLIAFSSCTTHNNRLPVDPYNAAASEQGPMTNATTQTDVPVQVSSPPRSNYPTPSRDLPSINTAAYLSGLSFDPGDAQYFDEVRGALSLNPAELALLQQNGFVVTDRLAWDRFLDAYAWIYSHDLPVLVTTDSILHSVHQSYDDLLADIEQAVIIPKLEAVLEGTQQQLAFARMENEDEELGALYNDVSTYLSVASGLLSGRPPVNGPATDLYSMAANAGPIEKINLFGSQRDIDFTLFKPRGHYTRSAELEQYFRSMNWLAQIDFRFVEFDQMTSQPILRQNQIAAAAVLRDAINSSGERQTWDEIDRLLETLVGAGDNMTLASFDRFMADMNCTAPADILKGDGKQMLALLLKNDYGNQRITGQLLYRSPLNSSDEPLPRPVSFMLMGQRFVIDSYVLGNLVYDHMIKDGKPIERALPSSLDAMYALGNDHALSHLEDQIQQYSYGPYLSTMRAKVDSLPDEFWTETAYNRWLGMVRTLNKPTTDNKYPEAMRTGAWADKMLQTQLASWAQLRHDNLLYAKQSVTTMIACEYPEGYVEPYPEFYNALYEYAKSGHDIISGVTQEETADWDRHQKNALQYFDNVMSAATQLKEMAEKELALQDFTAGEEDFLKSVVIRHQNENNMCGAPPYTWDGWYPGMFYAEDDNPALIADVHTNPNDEGPLAPARVLHAAIGAVAPLCLAAETDEGSTLYVGPSFTYYDVVETGYPPVRLTDEEWRSRLSTGGQPPHPDWTRSFLVPEDKIPLFLR